MDQPGFKLVIEISAFCVLGLKVCATVSGPPFLLVVFAHLLWPSPHPMTGISTQSLRHGQDPRLCSLHPQLSFPANSTHLPTLPEMLASTLPEMLASGTVF